MTEISSLNHQKQATTLYTLLGRAVWAIQHLEDALNKAIILKNPKVTTKIRADDILDLNRKGPLGQAVTRAKKEKVFSEALQKTLHDFLLERNWLIHRCMHESVDEMGAPLNADALFSRIRNIELSALSLTDTITIDMLEFVKSKGRGDIVESVKKSYIEWQKSYSAATST